MASKSTSTKAAQQAKVHDQKLMRGRGGELHQTATGERYPYLQLRRALQFQTIRIR